MYDTIPMWRHNGEKTILDQVKRETPKFSPEEIDDIWASAVKKYKGYIVETAIPTGSGKQKYFDLQNWLISDKMAKYINEGVKWLANIDADEIIQGNVDLLKNADKNLGRVRMFQDIFPNIRSGGSFNSNRINGKLNTQKITECYKNIVRPCAVKKWIDVHYGIELNDGFSMKTGERDLYFEHHCGRKHRECPAQ